MPQDVVPSERALAVPGAYRLGRTFSVYRMGPGDPTLRLRPGRLQAALLTPEGPVALEAVQRNGEIHLRSWGTGRAWLDPHLPAFLGLQDRPDLFNPPDPAMRAIWKKSLGTHLPRLPTVFTRLMQIVLLQLVTTAEGFRAWRRIALELGTPAPGPLGLVAPPTPERVAGASWSGFVAHGTPHAQARTLIRLARGAPSIEQAASHGAARLTEHILATYGLGPWSEAYLRGTAMGDPDAVLVGDHNLPHTCAWLLAREERGTDARMLELLEPYAGHRFRAIRAIWSYGVRAPRRGPKRAPRPLYRI